MIGRLFLEEKEKRFAPLLETPLSPVAMLRVIGYLPSFLLRPTGFGKARFGMQIMEVQEVLAYRILSQRSFLELIIILMKKKLQ